MNASTISTSIRYALRRRLQRAGSGRQGDRTASACIIKARNLGRINQLVMLVAVSAIIAMALSAGVMWWKRRPRSLALRYPQDQTCVFRAPSSSSHWPPDSSSRWSVSHFFLALAIDMVAPKLFT